MNTLSEKPDYAFVVDKRSIIDQWVDRILDAIADDLVFDSRDDVRVVLNDYKASIERVEKKKLAKAVKDAKLKVIQEIIDAYKKNTGVEDDVFISFLKDMQDLNSEDSIS